MSALSCSVTPVWRVAASEHEDERVAVGERAHEESAALGTKDGVGELVGGRRGTIVHPGARAVVEHDAEIRCDHLGVVGGE
jgi:hypothetical protein